MIEAEDLFQTVSATGSTNPFQ